MAMFLLPIKDRDIFFSQMLGMSVFVVLDKPKLFFKKKKQNKTVKPSN